MPGGPAVSVGLRKGEVQVRRSNMKHWTSPATPLLDPGFGRDIALRCPRPRNSGAELFRARRGSGGAARHPYRVKRFNA